MTPAWWWRSSGWPSVKPAEFVVFKLSQWAGGTETETIGG